MAGERADILFKAELDASGAITSLQAFKGEAGTASAQAGGAFGALASQWSKLVAGMAAFMGARALVGFLKDSVAGAMEAEDAVVKLDATLKATGYSAGLTGNQIRLFAREMSYLSGTTEEEIANAAALLSTYKEVRGEGFERTIVVARDLAAVMGTDLASATRMLGKAQQDPIQGMTMMRRAGIVLTDAEKDLVKQTVELNGVQAGQAKLLELVESRVKGVADAMAGTLSGQLKTMANQWGEIKETLGGFIIKSADLPGVTKFWTDFFTAIRKGTEGVGTAQQGMADALTRATAAQLTAYADKLKAQIETLKEAAKGTDHTTESYRKNIAALMDAKAKLGEVTRELKAKTVAETAAAEAAKRSIDLTEEQVKALESLLAKINPIAAAEKEYAAQVKLLEAAKKSGEYTARQYADGMLYAAKQMAEARKAGLELKPIIIDLTATFKKWEESQLQALPKAGNLATWVTYFQNIAQEAKAPMKGLGDESAKIFADAFKDGFLAVLQGDDFKDPLKLIFGGFAGMFAQALGEQLQNVMTGKGVDKEALKAAGLLDKEGKFNLGGAAMMVGGIIGSIGMAKQSQGLAAAGGAVSGGAAAAMMGAGPIGIIAAAVVMGVLSWMGAKGPSAESAQMGLRGGKGYVTEITGGVNKEAERQVAQAITARYQTTVMGFRDVLRKMEADLGKVPDVSLTFNEKTKNLQSAMDAFIKGTVPRAVFEAYKPALMDALTSLGVGADRMKEELANFTALDFDTAMAGFARWISALVDLTDVTKLLQKTPEEMRAEVNRTMREGFLAGFEDVMDRAAELAEGSADLFSKEQVANAEQLIALGKEQYQNTLNYISQLESISKGISEMVAGTLLGFEEKRAAEAGPGAQGQFYERQLALLQGRLGGATSAEQLAGIMAQIDKYVQVLWGLNLPETAGGAGPKTPWGEEVPGTRAWAEEQLRKAAEAAQIMIAKWEEEAALKAAALAAVLEAQRLALVAATNAAGSLADGLTGAKDGLDDLNGAAGDLAETLRDVREQLAGLAEAWTAGGGGGAPPTGREGYA